MACHPTSQAKRHRAAVQAAALLREDVGVVPAVIVGDVFVPAR